jgi:hypothetical protein
MSQFSEYKENGGATVEALKEIIAGIFLAAVLIGFVVFAFSVTP